MRDEGHWTVPFALGLMLLLGNKITSERRKEGERGEGGEGGGRRERGGMKEGERKLL